MTFVAAVVLGMLPPGSNPFVRTEKSDAALRQIREDVYNAVNQARVDGKELLEVDFPPLLGFKTALDDVSNVELLNANRDFAMELVPRFGLGPGAWLCLLDAEECKLAKECYPGATYQEATIISLAQAARRCSGRQVETWLESATASMRSQEGDVASDADVAEPGMFFVVQPCEEGRTNDWLNMELLSSGQGQGVPIVCINGFLDKLRSGYYPRWIQSAELRRCGDSFLSRFEPTYILKAVQAAGRSAWLHKLYGSPWEVYVQHRDAAELVLQSDTRPDYDEISRSCATAHA